ncbi:MAG: hypothetical protein ACPL68_08310, partial [Candidatus Hydrothermia bacterium]
MHVVCQGISPHNINQAAAKPVVPQTMGLTSIATDLFGLSEYMIMCRKLGYNVQYAQGFSQ